MSALLMVNPLSTVALTGNQVAPRWDNPRSSSAPLAELQEQSFRASKGAVHVVVKNTITSSADSLPGWVEPTVEAFVGIQTLPENWNSYNGKVINRGLVDQSIDLLVSIMQQDSPAPSVVPLADGGLQIEWHRRQQDLEIMFSADESPQFFYHNRATGLVDEGPVHETGKLIGFVKDLL